MKIQYLRIKLIQKINLRKDILMILLEVISIGNL